MRVEARSWRIHAENAHHRWTERVGRIVRLTDERGTEGVGEASPLPGYTDETVAEVDAALVGLSERLRRTIDDATDPEDGLSSLLVGTGSPSLRFAVETAFWDLWSRRKALPLAVLWGASVGAEVLTARLVDLLVPQAWPDEAPATIKVKVGRPGAWTQERAALEAMRARYPRTPVRVDVNQSFTNAEVADRLDELTATFGSTEAIDFVEEPSPGVWPENRSVRLARDESLRRPGAALAPAEVAVVKPTVLGGISAAERWRTDAPTVVISHAFEGPVAHAAAAAWAVARAPQVVAGLGPHAGILAWHDVEVGHVDGDVLRVPDRPGLGMVGAGAGRAPRRTP